MDVSLEWKFVPHLLDLLEPLWSVRLSLYRCVLFQSSAGYLEAVQVFSEQPAIRNSLKESWLFTSSFLCIFSWTTSGYKRLRYLSGIPSFLFILILISIFIFLSLLSISLVFSFRHIDSYRFFRISSHRVFHHLSTFTTFHFNNIHFHPYHSVSLDPNPLCFSL